MPDSPPTPPLRVLFVDDEPHLLHGLEHALRHRRDVWQARFADGGAAALAELEQAPADVVVSDMRMPGMTGGDLLGEVLRRWPSTIRIILSGYADRELIHRTIGTAHQFLQKPCAVADIEATVQRMWSLRRVLSNAALPELVGGMQALPSLPQAHARLSSLLEAQQPDMDAVASLIAADMGMSARVLQLLNSAFFGNHGSIADPALASRLLGVGTLRSLVSATNAFVSLDAGRRTWFDPEALHQHGMQVSRLARGIAVSLSLPEAQIEEATVAGLLHDAGSLLLAAHRPREHTLLARRLLHEGDILTERMVLGGTHGEIAAYLLGLWGLPPRVVEAVAHHHEPGRVATGEPCPLTCVHAADAIVNQREGHPERNLANLEYLAGLGLADSIPAWTALAN